MPSRACSGSFKAKCIAGSCASCAIAGIAEDLTIETFWRIHRAHARFDPGRSFAAWARRIATNTALDYLKKSRPEVALPEDLPAAALPDPGVEQDVQRASQSSFRPVAAEAANCSHAGLDRRGAVSGNCRRVGNFGWRRQAASVSCGATIAKAAERTGSGTMNDHNDEKIRELLKQSLASERTRNSNAISGRRCCIASKNVLPRCPGSTGRCWRWWRCVCSWCRTRFHCCFTTCEGGIYEHSSILAGIHGGDRLPHAGSVGGA